MKLRVCSIHSTSVRSSWKSPFVLLQLLWLLGTTRLALRDCWAWSTALTPSLPEQYAGARQVRIQQGPQAAHRLYQDVLRKSNYTDVTTATRLAASPWAHSRLEQLFASTNPVNHPNKQRSHWTDWKALFLQCGYTAQGVAQRLGVPDHVRQAQAPIYVTPAAAGAHTTWPWVDRSDDDDDGEALLDALDALVALCLAGLAVPYRLLQRALPVSLLQSLLDVVWVTCDGCKGDDQESDDGKLVYSLVQIVPVDLQTIHDTLLLFTDWHPRTLSLTNLRSSAEHAEGPVMYIGPDSLALVQHWLDDPALDHRRIHSHDDAASGRCLLDVGTGSGIQALVALAVGAVDRAVCLDVNPRALRFCAANAALNGLSDCIDLVWGDAISDRATLRWDDSSSSTNFCPLESVLRELSQSYDLITANPPFLPVPPQLANRHGWFSDGGPSGEAVLEAAVRLAGRWLRPSGYLAVVSEFFFGFDVDDEHEDGDSQLKARLGRWWNDSSPFHGTGLLLTNEFPVSVETYAERRADSLEEYERWMEHLRSLKIGSASPGLLYLRKDPLDGPGLRLHHRTVPKAPEGGSIWTPSNRAAIRFTRDAVRDVFDQGPIATLSAP